MLNIIGKKKLYFWISFLMIVPGVVSLALFGLRPSIDFTGGSRLTFSFARFVDQSVIDDVKTVFDEQSIEIVTSQPSENSLIIRTKPLDEGSEQLVLTRLRKEYEDVGLEQFETIGPVIGQETTLNALYAILIASVMIVLYIAWSFRNIPKPLSSFRFGLVAIFAVLHDVLLVVGIFSILGYFYQIEIDSLFVTALLTVVGFSVHDTIVVFDRIRENLRLSVSLPFEQVVNNSIIQTMVRSVNTSFTTLLVLLTLFLFGGDSIRWFVFALFIGIASGTYSSIFTASPLLVVWENWDKKRKRNS